MNIGEYLPRRSQGVNIKKVQNNGLKQDKKARKVLDWLAAPPKCIGNRINLLVHFVIYGHE